jgi:PelA/Pel-15E family pectate lyase
VKFRYLYIPLAILVTTCGCIQAQQRLQGTTWRGILQHPVEWYGSEEATRIADNVLLYQHENGGWSKNIDMAQVLDKSGKAKVVEEGRTARSTIDNGATFTQLNYLAWVYQITRAERFKDSVLRGIDYVLDAQYENGGWPQYYPIREGYYQHITYNDGAMVGVMRLLRDVAQKKQPYIFVDQLRQDRAAAAIQKGLEIILRTQITVNGELTAWCAQHDRETLAPAQARTYELPSISGGESAGLITYLMEIGNPDDRVIRAVESAVEWYERSKITGVALIRKEDTSLEKGYDRVVVKKSEASPLWGRFYDIKTNRPIFVGRDGVIKHSLAEIEYERRVGYSYIGEYGAKVLATFPAWKAKWNGQ